jgi:deoxyribonuclease IV
MLTTRSANRVERRPHVRVNGAPECRLRPIHANDSRDGCGSHRDRHENFGAGQIGTAPFAALLRHPATGGVPFVVETPGLRAAAAADIATLKALRGQGQAVRAPAGAMR